MLILRAVVTGMLVMLAGTVPRNLLFAANLQIGSSIPWAAPVALGYLWLLWHVLASRDVSSLDGADWRRDLRATPIPARQWAWSLAAGTLAIVALVLALRLANGFVALPEQRLPDLGSVPRITIATLLLLGAPIAGIVEEAAFRGVMQRPIERRYGLVLAILVTGTMFAIAHLDFTPILWPYYLAVAAIYGTLARMTDSIKPAIVLHTAGNLYSTSDLLLHGRAEWQAPAGAAGSVWRTGPDLSFWMTSIALAAAIVAAVAAYRVLAGTAAR